MGSKKKNVVVTSDPLALIAEKTKVSKMKEKVVVSLDSEGSDADDFSELKKIIAFLAKAFNRIKFYSKPTNNNLRTSSTSQSANKKQEFVKSDDKQVEKKADEKRRYMKASSSSADEKIYEIIIDLEDEVVNLLEKEKVNLETIESLKSKGVESSENVSSELENQTENDCLVIEKKYDKEENPKVIAPGMFKLNVSQCASPISMSKSSCESNNVEIKLKRKRPNPSSSQSWLWHQRLSHLNFATINNLVKNNLVQGKIHQKHHKSKMAFASNNPLYLLHMDLCGLMRIQSINGKQYVLVVVDDYSRYTWVLFLHSKDEASEVIISFIKKTQVNLKLQVQRIRTDNGTEFKNKTLAKFFDEDVGKLKAKGDIGVFVGYSKESVAFRIYNKRTRRIHKSMDVNFDEISEIASKQFSLEPSLSKLTEALKDDDWVSEMQEELDQFARLKKPIVVTSDPLDLITEKTKVSKSKEKVVVSSDYEGSSSDDFSELKKITALLAKAFNRRKFYSKPTNNNLRTSSSYQSANKKQEFVKTDTKKVKKKDDEKKRDMRRVKCYNYKKEGHFAKDCKKAKHTRTKHIDVRYHFIKDHVEKGTIELYFVGTEYQLADLFTKSLPEARFKFLVEKLGKMSHET
uniref:Integrase catalytic domain-containing protein n=1 Tax=Tanacetum cinerariifolium TaxID=118510 RepID=A0A6L2K4C2_TANCI|nr:hypothetical protein [Tanacetum cinerariifolium]